MIVNTLSIQQFIDGNGFHCGIWSNKELIGVIGLHYLDLINEAFQKKGIMTKCTKALIRYVYEEYDINRIEIQMSTKNKKAELYQQDLDSHKRVY